MGTRQRNAAAEVKARNGAKNQILSKKTRQDDTAVRPAIASALTAVLDRHGLVVCVFAGRSAARAFLRGGVA